MSEFKVETLGQQGDGICMANDERVFARGVLPGEVIAGEVADGRIAQPRILHPSDQRVRPPCRHSQSCGGCTFQHASDDFVAGWKVEQTRAALQSCGIEAEVTLAHVSAPGTRRRATLAGTRTKKGALVGFHAKRSDTLIEVPDCAVLDGSNRAALPALRDLTIMLASRRGEVGFAVTATQQGLDIDIRGAAQPSPDQSAQIAGIAENAGIARISLQGEVLVQHAQPTIQLGGVAVPLPPGGAFLQATPDGQAKMQALVGDILSGSTKLADLFCGLGTFALPIAREIPVDGYDSGAEMIKALQTGLRGATGLRPVNAITRDLFRDPLLAGEFAPYDGVVIDPPRAGAAAQVEQLAESAVPTIAAVSCNPGTFARDAATLVAAGYRIRPVHVIDQFRWSPHIELVAGFTRPAGA